MRHPRRRILAGYADLSEISTRKEGRHLGAKRKDRDDKGSSADMKTRNPIMPGTKKKRKTQVASAATTTRKEYAPASPRG